MTAGVELSEQRALLLRDRPVLCEILQKSGHLPLVTWAEFLSKNERIPDKKRKEDFICAVSSAVTAVLGPERAASVRRQLEAHYYISTVDHMGPLSHPFFAHSNILSALPFTEHESDHENTIVLACSNVSLGNSSQPRSLSFHTDVREDVLERINLTPSHSRHLSVFGFRPYAQHELVRSLDSTIRSLGVSHAFATRLGDLIQKVYMNPILFTLASYADQITVTNAELWTKFFAGERVTSLVYLEQERIVMSLLLLHHLETSTDVHRIIFDSETRERAYIELEGISGAHSKAAGSGTFLFWYIAKEHSARVSLWLDGDSLASRDGSVRIPLRPESIRDHLEQGLLLPNTALSLMTLACYYGVKCLGGFSQVNYLTKLDHAYARIAVNTAPPSDTFTKGFCGDIVFAMASLPSGTKVPATGLDLALHATDSTLPTLQAVASSLTLAQSFDLMVPMLYSALTPDKHQAVHAASASESDLPDSCVHIRT